eukprot:scaffold112032_cov17-Tisochrysis_lutea.AAC.3
MPSYCAYCAVQRKNILANGSEMLHWSELGIGQHTQMTNGNAFGTRRISEEWGNSLHLNQDNNFLQNVHWPKMERGQG